MITPSNYSFPDHYHRDRIDFMLSLASDNWNPAASLSSFAANNYSLFLQGIDLVIHFQIYMTRAVIQ